MSETTTMRRDVVVLLLVILALTVPAGARVGRTHTGPVRRLEFRTHGGADDPFAPGPDDARDPLDAEAPNPLENAEDTEEGDAATSVVATTLSPVRPEKGWNDKRVRGAPPKDVPGRTNAVKEQGGGGAEKDKEEKKDRAEEGTVSEKEKDKDKDKDEEEEEEEEPVCRIFDVEPYEYDGISAGAVELVQTEYMTPGEDIPEEEAGRLMFGSCREICDDSKLLGKLCRGSDDYCDVRCEFRTDNPDVGICVYKPCAVEEAIAHDMTSKGYA